ncbi:MAG: ferredoxin family protein [Deltaproteobacteria bacterium]
MTYIIAEPCVDVKDRTCVEVCPVDCIKESPDGSSKMLYIDPQECIDCGACVPACPVEAIFPEQEVPEKWKGYIPLNYQFFGRNYS